MIPAFLALATMISLASSVAHHNTSFLAVALEEEGTFAEEETPVDGVPSRIPEAWFKKEVESMLSSVSLDSVVVELEVRERRVAGEGRFAVNLSLIIWWMESVSD